MEKARIMLVEDEVVVSADIKAKLQKMGYVVPAIVRYAEDVLETASREKPDLILMDINLKGEMDGTEAARKVREQLDIPIVFLTSYKDDDTLAKAKVSGPFGYLTKPVRFDELRISLEMASYKASLDRTLKENELRFKTVADFTYEWEAWLTPDNRYAYVSPSCERVSGYKPEDFIETPGLLNEIVVIEDQPLVAEHLTSCHVETGGLVRLEFRINHKDGGERWIEHLCQPVYRSEGEYLGRRTSNRDISNRKKIEQERNRLIDELQKALEEVKTLSGMLPICSFCKSIRDDKGYWNRLEQYIAEHSEVQFSHGICENCLKQHYPEYAESRDKKD